MGRQGSIGRNPYGERKKALAFEELEVSLQVVVIGGGRYHHEHLTIASLPYQRQHNGISRDARMVGKPGQVITLTSWFVKVTDARSPFREPTLPSWYNGMQSSRNKPEEYFLSEMGLCPSSLNGHWSLKYTVRRSDYDPRGLHS